MAGDIKPTSDATRSVYGTRGSAKSQGSPAGGAGTAGKASASPGGSDTVDLTSQAQRFLEIEAQLASTPVVDAARVAEIRDSLADGSYQINAEEIADKMLQVARQAANRGD